MHRCSDANGRCACDGVQGYGLPAAAGVAFFRVSLFARPHAQATAAVQRKAAAADKLTLYGGRARIAPGGQIAARRLGSRCGASTRFVAAVGRAALSSIRSPVLTGNLGGGLSRLLRAHPCRPYRDGPFVDFTCDKRFQEFRRAILVRRRLGADLPEPPLDIGQINGRVSRIA